VTLGAGTAVLCPYEGEVKAAEPASESGRYRSKVNGKMRLSACG